jgi:hypothetical protein
MVGAGCLQAEIIRHFKKNNRTVKKWLALHGLEPRKPYRKPPPARTGSIYTSLSRTWRETNTQEKIDALFTDAVRKRFWSKVSGRGDGECWPWNGSTLVHGYGSFGVKNMNFRASRVAYLLSKGPIAADLHVMHACNTRLCCNPAHLDAGTVQENVRHRELHGNPAKAMRSGRRKLRADEVYAIRESTETPNVLAQRYGIHPTMIGTIRMRKKWRSLPERDPVTKEIVVNVEHVHDFKPSELIPGEHVCSCGKYYAVETPFPPDHQPLDTQGDCPCAVCRPSRDVETPYPFDGEQRRLEHPLDKLLGGGQTNPKRNPFE